MPPGLRALRAPPSAGPERLQCVLVAVDLHPCHVIATAGPQQQLERVAVHPQRAVRTARGASQAAERRDEGDVGRHLQTDPRGEGQRPPGLRIRRGGQAARFPVLLGPTQVLVMDEQFALADESVQAADGGEAARPLPKSLDELLPAGVTQPLQGGLRPGTERPGESRAHRQMRGPLPDQEVLEQVRGVPARKDRGRLGPEGEEGVGKGEAFRAGIHGGHALSSEC